jgi:hypothetical protein
MEYNSLAYEDWLRGWQSWASNRKRGKLAQFIVGLLEKGEGARWVDITKGKFELTEWHSIAQEWYRQKTRASQTQDAPCMLRKGLPRAFPDLEEVKQESTKDGTQYRSRMFQCPPELVQEVYMCATGQPLPPMADHFVKEEDEDQDSFGGYPEQPIIIDNTFHAIPQNNGFFGAQVTPPHLQPHLQPHHQMQHYSVQQDVGGWSNMGSPQGSDSVPSPAQGPYPSHQQHSLTSPPPISHHSEVDYSNSPQTNITTSSTGSPAMNYNYYQEAPPTSSGYIPSTSSVHGPYNNGSPSVPSTSQGQGQIQDQMTFALLMMRALPNKSPCEGGGEVALIFRQQLPVGTKFVRFQSLNGGGMHIVEPRIENESTLSAPIPSHPKAEMVFLQLICNGQVISQTEFEFYQTVTDDLQHIYHLLNNNMSAFFPTMGGLGQFSAPQTQGGQSTGMTNVYGHGGNLTNYAYLLLLGACKWGISSLVLSILRLPNMFPFLALPTPNGLPEDIARENKHTELASQLQSIRENYCFSYHPSSVTVTSRAARPSLDELLSKISSEDKTPEQLTSSVMKGIEAVAKECNMKKAVETVVSSNPDKEADEDEDKRLQEIEDLTEQVSSLSIENRGLKRELDLSKRNKVELERKVHMLEQEVEDESPPTIAQLRKERFRRTGSPIMSARSVLPRDPSIMSDHGICVSFDEDVAQRRLSSFFQSGQFSLLSNASDKSITLTVPGDMNIADSLIYEAYHIVTEDYPPNDARPIFRSGDRIIEINGSSTRGLSSPQFDDLLRGERVSVKVITNAKN